MPIVIEKNKPIPGADKKDDGPSTAHLRDVLSWLDVDESFWVEKGPQAQRLRSAIQYEKLMGCQKVFTTRSVEGGVRVWRIS